MVEIKDVLRNMETGVYDFTCNGECSNCGSCCTNFLPISDREIYKIRDYLRSHKVREQKVLFPIAGNALDMTCPFRDEAKKKCLIYPVRPAICRDFRCDKPAKQIQASKELYHGKYAVVDMREVFFGGNKKWH